MQLAWALGVGHQKLGVPVEPNLARLLPHNAKQAELIVAVCACACNACLQSQADTVPAVSC